MTDTEILNDTVNDLQAAPAQCVIYLEGRTDVQVFFALLGVVTPVGNLHQGVLVRGLTQSGGSGAAAVTRRIQVATTLRRPFRVFGLLDGDGKSLEDLAPRFDPPCIGPLFAWKAYSIENLLQKTGWPRSWGARPDWHRELRAYAPYVGLNRIHRQFSEILVRLGIARFTNPEAGRRLQREADISRNLGAGQERLRRLDVQQIFRAEARAFRNALDDTLDTANCLYNGKWLLSHLGASKTGKSTEACRADWAAHACSVGGLQEVKDWWTRTIGKAP